MIKNLKKEVIIALKEIAKEKNITYSNLVRIALEEWTDSYYLKMFTKPHDNSFINTTRGADND